MKTKVTVAMALAGVVASFGWAEEAERRSAGYWSARNLQETMLAEVVPKAKATEVGIAAKALVSTPTHAVLLASRYKTFPEVHEYDTDIFIVQEGAGTLQVGGELVDRRQTGPGQMTGSSIRGGQMFQSSAGDVLYVPKNTPHMWHLQDGQRVSYVAVKVTDR